MPQVMGDEWSQIKQYWSRNELIKDDFKGKWCQTFCPKNGVIGDEKNRKKDVINACVNHVRLMIIHSNNSN